MPVSVLDVRTTDGVMDVHLHSPTNGTPTRTVVLFHDAAGLRPVMHQMAERLASANYLVALPNYLYRAGAYQPFDVAAVFTDPAERARLESVTATADQVSVMRDTGTLLDDLASHPDVPAGPVGCFGYCLGGHMAFAAAGTHPKRVAAAASIHGGRLATDAPTSPHRRADAVRGELYFGVADNDPICTPESQALLTAALDQADVTYHLERYPGAAHGFAVEDNPTYDQDAAQRHWERLLSLFARTLPAG